MEIVKGKVVKVLFKNEENGYTVITIKLDYTDKELKKIQSIIYTNILTVTCYFDRTPVVGEEIEFTGEFDNSKYGLQLKASSYKRINQDSLDSVIAYLSSDYFPNIGIKIATKIYEVLGKNCLNLIRNDKTVLDKIPQLTLTQKDTIYTNLYENQKREKDTLDFIKLGFTNQMAQRIITSLSKNEINEAKSNPYLLIDKVDGIGFLRADKIAYEIGIEKDAPIRIKACIKYILQKLTFETGNCYTNKDLLYRDVFELTTCTEDIFNEYLNELEKDGKIVFEDNDIYDYSIYDAEGKLATYIASRIIYNKNEISKSKIIKAYKKVKSKEKIEYSEKQEEAIIKAFEENIIVITGGPGTGKTTIVKGIIEVYKSLFPKSKINEDIYLLAPTGRASKRMAEVTGMQAQTIHKFLAYDGTSFHINENNPVSCNLVIIDEMSMVDVILASKLFAALTSKCRVIIVGDVDQIPSVSPGNVLEDIINTNKLVTIKLDKIHRQVSDSTIIRLAHEINHGTIPEDILEKQKDRNFINIATEEGTINSIKMVIHRALSQGMSLQKDIQVLIPMYKRQLGIDNVNEILQNEFNPLTDNTHEVKFGKQKFRINDKVIQLVNRNEDSIMNGDIGYVESFEYNDGYIIAMHVNFDNNLVRYDKEQYDQLKLAYAISIHKSQGSEFTTTIIPFSNSYSIMLKRRLYYTAITRAKKYLIMLGSFSAFVKAVNNYSFSRNTKLKQKIIASVNNYKNEISYLVNKNNN